MRCEPWLMSRYRPPLPRPPLPRPSLPRPARASSRVVRSAGLRPPPAKWRRLWHAAGRWNWTALAALLAAAAAAAGVVFTGLSLQATRQQNTVAEQAQLTDRFTKAVDQLDRAGLDHLQARLGAIYALERLARDSPRDHETVVEVLAAFVRTTAARPVPLDTASDAETARPCSADQPATARLGADVQAALTVLGRRDTTRDGDTRIDLSHTCLGGADLSGLDLGSADFLGADLSRSVVVGADLANANLVFAHLGEAVVIRTTLTNATLGRADLAGTRIRGVDLTGASLYQANLAGSNLVGTNLSGAHLESANLTGADLESADLTGADLTGTNLTDVRRNEWTVVKDTVTDERTTGVWWR